MMIGSVTLKNVVRGSAPRSPASSSRDRSIPETRARTVIATNDTQNMMCASRIVMNPWGTRAFTNIESREDPRTMSGDAIARKLTKFTAPAQRKRYRPSAMPRNVPRMVEKIVARNATSRVSFNDVERSGNAKRSRQASSDACSHLMLYLPAGVLNAKMIITAIGMIRYMMNNVVYEGRMNRVHRLLDGVFGGCGGG